MTVTLDKEEGRLGTQGLLETHLTLLQEERDVPECRNRSPEITEYLPWGDFPK